MKHPRVLLLVAVLALAPTAGCGGDDAASGDGSPTGTDDGAGSQTAPAPDLTPQEVCDALDVDELMAVMDGDEPEVDTLDGPPQCSVSYANSDALRDQGAANGTNLLVFVPTSEELEGKTGADAIAVASQYAFYDSDPEPIDIGEDALTDGVYTYVAVGGRIIGVAAGDGMTEEHLLEVTELAVSALAP